MASPLTHTGYPPPFWSHVLYSMFEWCEQTGLEVREQIRMVYIFQGLPASSNREAQVSIQVS